jgi:hypothetical protein
VGDEYLVAGLSLPHQYQLVDVSPGIINSDPYCFINHKFSINKSSAYQPG